MPFIFNGTTIPENVANALMVNGVSMTKVIANGVTVWTQSLYSGPVSGFSILATKNLTAGVDFPADTLITICMCGGGGNGGGGGTNDGGGGGSGNLRYQATFTTGQVVSAVIGGPSGTTSFAGYTAAGAPSASGDNGQAGVNGGGRGGNRGYAGTGRVSDLCFAATSGGALGAGTVEGGGGAGGFGNGAKGGVSATANTGAGGGGRYGGQGGSGRIVLSW